MFNKLLVDFLIHFNQFEDADMQNKRKAVLKELESIINKWVFFLSCKLNREIDSTNYDGAKIFPFGS
jgi:poly(A) polymerase Pap1